MTTVVGDKGSHGGIPLAKWDHGVKDGVTVGIRYKGFENVSLQLLFIVFFRLLFGLGKVEIKDTSAAACRARIGKTEVANFAPSVPFGLKRRFTGNAVFIDDKLFEKRSQAVERHPDCNRSPDEHKSKSEKLSGTVFFRIEKNVFEKEQSRTRHKRPTDTDRQEKGSSFDGDLFFIIMNLRHRVLLSFVW